MRTTVTLEEDVAVSLKRSAHERRVSFKVALNDALRRGLEEPSRQPQPYQVPRLELSARPELNLDKALQLAAELEDREILRKAARGR